MSPGLEVMGRSGAGNQGGAGQQANAWNLADQGDIFVIPGQGSDLPLGELHLVLEIVDFGEQLGEDDAETLREPVLVQDSHRMSLCGGRAGGNGMAELSQAPAQAVDASGPSRFPLLTDPVELLDLLLINRADGNRVDPLTAVGIDQGLGVGVVGLVPQAVLSDELSGQNDGPVSKRGRLPGPIVGAATSFKKHSRPVSLGQELLELPAAEPQVRVGLALRVGDRGLEDILCEIDGDEIKLVHGLLLSWDIQRFTPECWHTAMPKKTREESISSFNTAPAKPAPVNANVRAHTNFHESCHCVSGIARGRGVPCTCRMDLARSTSVALARWLGPCRARDSGFVVVRPGLLRVRQGHTRSMGSAAKPGGCRPLPVQPQSNVRGGGRHSARLGRRIPLGRPAGLCACCHRCFPPAGSSR